MSAVSPIPVGAVFARLLRSRAVWAVAALLVAFVAGGIMVARQRPAAPLPMQGILPQPLRLTYPNMRFVTEATQRQVVYSGPDLSTNKQIFVGLTKADLLERPRAEGSTRVAQMKAEQEALARSGYSWTVEGLLSAARAGDTRALATFIRGGIPVDSKNAFGSTALYAAAESNQATAVKVLIAAGADINTTSNRLMSPLHRAAEQNLPAMVELLLALGARPDAANSDGWTPLFFAVNSNNQDLTQLFLKQGADVNHRDRFGRTALMLAVRKGSLQLARFLLGSGAQPNQQDMSGLAALHVAVREGHYQLAKLLLENGASATLPAGSQTPVDMALAKQDLALANLLTAHGATAKNVLGSGKK